MKKILTLFSAVLLAVSVDAQIVPPLEQLKSEPQKAYGTDYPYKQDFTTLTNPPKGYKPFYISHYARHGSRYC